MGDKADNGRAKHRTIAAAAALIVLVLITRLPFLGNGYGLDGDAWRLGHAAAVIATTDGWESSRPPGHPVQEYACSLLWGGGPYLLNGATALLCALSAVLVVLCSKRMGIRRPWLVGFAFAFTPAVFLHSTSSMDYVWAVTFLLAGFLAALSGRAVLTGLALALAIGCRANSVAMVPAILLALLMVSPQQKRWSRLVLAAACCGVLGTAFYVPVVVANGLDYLTNVAVFGYPWWGSIALQVSVQTWGWLGSFGLLLAAGSALLYLRKHRRELRQPNNALGLASVLVAASGVVLYLLLPYESGYLVPVIPFTLMPLAMWTNPRIFALLALLLATCNVADLRPGGPMLGMQLRDRRDRIAEVARLDEIIELAASLEKGSVIVAGPMQYKVLTVLFEKPSTDVEWIYYANPRLLERKFPNATLYYIPEIARWHSTYFELDLEGQGGRPLGGSP